MTYEFQINAGVAGADQVTRLGAETDKQVDRTKRLDEALTAYLQKNDKLIQAQKTYAEQQAKIAQLTEQYREAQQKKFEAEERGWRRILAAQDEAIRTNQKLSDDAVKNAEKAARANEQIGASVKNWIQNPLGAAGEAAESFLTKYGAIGGAAVGVGLGLAGAGAAAIAAANATGRYAQEMFNLSARTGLSVTEAQLWSREAQVAGVNAASLTTAMRSLSRGLQEGGDEGKAQRKVMDEMGISYQSLSGKLLPVGQILDQIFDKLGKMGSGPERDFFANTLLGRGGLELVPMAGRLRELGDRIKETGVIMSEEGAQRARRYSEDLEILKLKWEALKAAMGEAAIGVIRVLDPGDFGHGGDRLPTQRNADGSIRLTAPGDLERTAGLDRSPLGLLTQSMFGIPGIMAGDRSRTAYQAYLAQQRRDPEYALKEAEASLAALPKPTQGSTPEKISEYEAAQQKVEGIKKQIAATKELASLNKEADNDLRSAQTFELSSLARINAAYDAKIAKLRESAAASHAALPQADIDKENRARGIELQREISRIGAQNRAAMGGVVEENERNESRIGKLRDKEFLAGLKTENANLTSQIDAGIHTLERSDDTEADAVRRRLEVLTRANAAGTRRGSITRTQAADSDLQARVAAAKELYAIESRRLAVTEDEQSRQKIIDDLRKKRADEIYRAEAEHDEAIYQARLDNEKNLETLREQDLAKYSEMAGSLFDAIHGRATNQWARSLATSQVKTLFSNVAGIPLQQIGHLLGSAVPNVGPLGTLLHGTLLDNANAAPAQAMQSTAKNTYDTVRAIKDLRNDLRSMTGQPPSNAVGDGGEGITAGATSTATAGALGQLLPISAVGSSTNSFLSSALNLIRGGGWTGSSASYAAAAPGGAYSVIGPPVLGNDPEAGQVQLGSAIPGSPVYDESSVWAGQAYTPAFDSAVAPQLAGASPIGAGLGAGAGLAMSAFGILNGIKQGGVSGGLETTAGAVGALGSGLSLVKALGGTLGSVASAIPILGAVAPLIGLVAGMFGNGPQQRSQQITDYLAKDQYLAPTALNVTQGMNGTYEDFDARGNLRTSNFSAVPTVSQPYITTRTLNGQQSWYDAPGVVQSPFSVHAPGGGQAPVAGGVTIHAYGGIQTIDAESFHQFLQKPASSMAVGESLATHLQSHEGRASNAIRFVAGS